MAGFGDRRVRFGSASHPWQRAGGFLLVGADGCSIARAFGCFAGVIPWVLPGTGGSSQGHAAGCVTGSRQEAAREPTRDRDPPRTSPRASFQRCLRWGGRRKRSIFGGLLYRMLGDGNTTSGAASSASAQGQPGSAPSLPRPPALPGTQCCPAASGGPERLASPCLVTAASWLRRFHRRLFLPPNASISFPWRLRAAGCTGTPPKAPLTSGAAPAFHGPTKWGENPNVSAAKGCSIPRMCYHPGSVSLVHRPRCSSLSPLFLLPWLFLSIGII